MSRRCHHGSPRHARPIRPIRRWGDAIPGVPGPAIAGEPRVEEELFLEDELPVEGGTAFVHPGGPLDDELPEPPSLAAPERSHPDTRPRESLPQPIAAASPPIHSTPPARLTTRPSCPARGPRPPREPAPVPQAALDATAAHEPDGTPGHGPGEQGGLERSATAPQLRRFIKSRAYVPMHELRRRFAINGDDDDVTVLDVDRNRVYVGLPEREGRLLGELFRGGDIGYELSLDPVSPVVVGVYPMRPVSRG